MGWFTAEAESIEEERRLAYVALSRARQVLVVSFVLSDHLGNPMVFVLAAFELGFFERELINSYLYLQEPSRFLNELPQNLLELQRKKAAEANANNNNNTNSTNSNSNNSSNINNNNNSSNSNNNSNNNAASRVGVNSVAIAASSTTVSKNGVSSTTTTFSSKFIF